MIYYNPFLDIIGIGMFDNEYLQVEMHCYSCCLPLTDSWTLIGEV